MNATIEDLKTRRSVRAFDPDAMPGHEVLQQVADAGTYAPTGMGMQSPVIVVVTRRETRDLLSRLNARVLGTGNDPFYGAPVVMVVLADKERPTHVEDGSLVMGNLLNAAHALGLGSCWIHRAREVFASAEGQTLLREWGLPAGLVGIGHCVVGYPLPGAVPVAKPRKEGYVRWVE